MGPCAHKYQQPAIPASSPCKQAGKPAGQAARQPEQQPAGNAPGAQVTQRPNRKPASPNWPTRNPAGQRATQAAASQVASQRANHANGFALRQPSRQPANNPAFYQARQAVSYQANKPVSQPATQPAEQPVGQPASQSSWLVGRPASEPSSQQARRAIQPVGQNRAAKPWQTGMLWQTRQWTIEGNCLQDNMGRQTSRTKHTNDTYSLGHRANFEAREKHAAPIDSLQEHQPSLPALAPHSIRPSILGCPHLVATHQQNNLGNKLRKKTTKTDGTLHDSCTACQEALCAKPNCQHVCISDGQKLHM